MRMQILPISHGLIFAYGEILIISRGLIFGVAKYVIFMSSMEIAWEKLIFAKLPKIHELN